MDLTGIRIGIDASGAKQGEVQFTQALNTMVGSARTVTQQIRSSLAGLGSGITFDGKGITQGLREIATTAGTVSEQVKKYFSGISDAAAGVKNALFSLRGVLETAVAVIGIGELVNHIAKIVRACTRHLRPEQDPGVEADMLSSTQNTQRRQGNTIK